ncbi:MAG: N-acetylmuramoyl-L-alanine amidase [Ahrensia sp.]
MFAQLSIENRSVTEVTTRLGLRMLWAFAMLVALVFPATALDVPVALDVDAAETGEKTTITLQFDQPVNVAHQLLGHPWRLVLDFEKIGFGFQPDQSDWPDLVRDVRWGDMSDTNSRIIFEIAQPFAVSEIRAVHNQALDVHLIEVDFALIDEATYQANMDAMLKTGSVTNVAAKSDRLGAQPLLSEQRSGKFIVVLDAGHGGIDSGAVGTGGTLEKNVTLTFAKELRERLEKASGLEVHLTRDSDVFIRLNDRVRFARQQGASLFVSLHADSVRQKYVRGATVYTISDKASDAVAAEVARSENLSDEIAGVSVPDDATGVVDILVDLARRETHGFSVQFARLAIEEIGRSTRLIKNPHRYAGFRVLKAPDVPSVLVEMGYLSNEQDEKLLNDAAWRSKLADNVASAIGRFAAMSGHNVAGLEVE